jgi:hypothetical protein
MVMITLLKDIRFKLNSKSDTISVKEEVGNKELRFIVPFVMVMKVMGKVISYPR